VGSSYRKRINFTSIDFDSCNPTSIIEGVGATTGLTTCYATPTSFAIRLDCFTVGGELLYTAPCGPDLVPCGELPNGIDESFFNERNQLTASPNPTTGQFILSGGNIPRSISIFTSTGQFVWEGSGNTIDLSAQPPGVYTAVVVSEGSSQALRLIVER
jgi:hypothetical protein